jgi:hypothetical protein
LPVSLGRPQESFYSRNAIITPYRDKTALEFRIANGRRSQLIDVQIQAILTKVERVSGSGVRKFYEPQPRAESGGVLPAELDSGPSDRFGKSDMGPDACGSRRR